MKSKFPSPTQINVSQALLFTGAIISILWSIYFAVVTISIPYQIELREGAAQVLTRLFLSGENPYVLENQPLGMNIYGLGYPMVVLPFARFFGNTLLVHRSVTLFFIVFSCLFVFLLVYKAKKDLSAALACGAFVMIGLIGHGGNGAFSSAMGAFLFLAAALIPRLRSFENVSLVLSAVLSLAAFYTKPYFVLAFGVVASFLFLFVSKKKSLVYAGSFLVLFAATFVFVRSMFPLYFVNIIIVNTSVTSLLYSHMFAQLSNLFFYFYPTVFLSALIFARHYENRTDVLEKQGFKNVLNFFEWQRPLVELTFNYYLYLFICALIAFIFVLGRHIGNDMNYAYQLLVPTFLCWFFQELDLGKRLSIFAALLVLFNLFSWEKDLLSPSMLEQKNSKEWSELFSYVHSSSNILNSSVEVSEVVNIGLTPIDSGQTIVFYLMKPFSDTVLSDFKYDALLSDGIKYTKFIDQSIEKQKFDLIINIEEKGTFYHVKLIEKYYSPVDEIVVDMPQTGQRWTLVIWEPAIK